MKKTALLSVVLLTAMSVFAQPQHPAQAQQPGISGMDVQLSNLLNQLERSARDTNAALGELRIQKWKTNSSQKQQAQENTTSLQRNLTYAIPELTAKIRQNPQDLNANFRLYRNLNALYDVLTNVAESAGAFGPRDEYEALAQPIASLDEVRRVLGDRLDQMTANDAAELNRLRSQIQSIRQAEAAAPPKKIIIDDNAPAKPKKTKTKKTPNHHQ